MRVYSRIWLGLREGSYEGVTTRWRRWINDQGEPLPTTEEDADTERQRADDDERRADDAERRLRELEAKLRED
jgi:hypothetical protein